MFYLSVFDNVPLHVNFWRHNKHAINVVQQQATAVPDYELKEVELVTTLEP